MASLKGLLLRISDLVARRIVRDSAKFRSSIPVVLSGPFAGMRYVSRSVGSVYCPKILGTYEKELHPIIEQCLACPHDIFVNIGAGEGYYAIGFAVRVLGLQVISYDRDSDARVLLEELSNLNGVRDRIAIREECSSKEIAHIFERYRKPLMIIDVEGAELELLDSSVAHSLSRATILVEIHDFVSSEIGTEIKSRFSSSHSITEISARQRTFRDFPQLASSYGKYIPRLVTEEIMKEMRPASMSWLFMSPNVPE